VVVSRKAEEDGRRVSIQWEEGDSSDQAGER